ncbi:hypothetical protein ACF058_22145 [Streptomyces sp. NPDC015501]|uniref:hypothetical protein n=1 Tax=unclassified Streptomyces TaxID=2593676 RepID=UPI00119FA452|nr:hypothetical protein A3L22_22995 [Streptomyces griseus subsp. griseus]
MTQAPNDRTNPPGGSGLPEGAGPIDTGTPVRRPAAPGMATRTVTGREKAAEPMEKPAAAPATGAGPLSPHAPGPASGPAAPDAPAPVPSAHDAAADPRTAPGPGAGPASPGDHVEDGPRAGRPLFTPEQREAFAARIQQAVTGFVEDPRRAVRDADATFEEVVADLEAALRERGRKLRAGKGEDAPAAAETEDLRIALQHYRDLTERLVRL